MNLLISKYLYSVGYATLAVLKKRGHATVFTTKRQKLTES